jgi:Thymidylate synthase
MYIKAATLDDLLHRVFERLLRVKKGVNPTRGPVKEIMGATLRLTNPRARLSKTEAKGTVFSCLGELLWYLSGSNKLDFISYYIKRYIDDSEDNKTIYGAYGPRIFDFDGINQLENLINTLRGGSTSRRAVIQLFSAKDLSEPRKKEIPCTCTIQFMARRGKLYTVAHMRSNDAYYGLPHDIFAFSMLQEIIARMLSLEIGDYVHLVGNIHLYDKRINDARKYLDEGWQSTNASMPVMPIGDPWQSIKKVLRAEKAIRTGKEVKSQDLELEPYWMDLVRLLEIFRHYKDNSTKDIQKLKKEIHHPIYLSYIKSRKRQKKQASLEQTTLDYTRE